MEWVQFENSWREYDKKISDNTRINKEILRRLLIMKPEKRISRIKLKSGFNLFSPIIFIALILILDVQFSFETSFFIGLALFLPIYLLTYVWDIRFFQLIRDINFSLPVTTIKKTVAELEQYKIKTTRVKYALMPFAMVGFILMIVQKFTFQFTLFSILPIILIVMVFLLSLYYTFKYSVYGQYKELNREIDEVLSLEKE